MTVMWKNRIAWIIIIISAGLLYLFANETVTLAVSAVCFASPALSAAILFLSGRKIKISMVRSCKDPDKQSTSLIIENSGLLPVCRMQLSVKYRNLRTAETHFSEIQTSVPGRGRSEIKLQSGFKHAGCYELHAGNVKVYDPLQLFFRRSADEDYTHITVMPKLFNTGLNVTASAAMLLESDKYADSRKGNDPGEVHGIREYVIGDPVKNIHWKLSEKTDRLMIKELGLPVTDQLLVLLDNCSGEKATADAHDAVASVYTSVLAALQRAGMDFSAGWFDAEKGYLAIQKITSEEDITAAADQYMAVPPTQESVLNSIERGETDRRFAHLIMAGYEIPSGTDLISNGCKITLLLCGHSYSETMEGGISIIGFDEYSYSSQLAGLEV